MLSEVFSEENEASRLVVVELHATMESAIDS